MTSAYQTVVRGSHPTAAGSTKVEHAKTVKRGVYTEASGPEHLEGPDDHYGGGMEKEYCLLRSEIGRK